MTKVRLTKVKSTHGNLRTDSAEGEAPTWPPRLGREFSLYGQGLSDPSLTRQIVTTPVRAVRAQASGYEFDTQNSTYRVVELPGK